MSSALAKSVNENQAASTPIAPNRPRFVWAILILVAAFWAILSLLKIFDLPIYAGFFSSVGSCALLALLFTAWWFVFGGGWLRDRALVFVSLIAIGIVFARFIDKTVGPIGLIFFGVPVGISLIAIWLLVTRNRSAAVREIGMLAAFSLVCGLMTVIRGDGIDGNQKPALAWRWTRSA